jgi:FkbM family methyltransferase
MGLVTVPRDAAGCIALPYGLRTIGRMGNDQLRRRLQAILKTGSRRIWFWKRLPARAGGRKILISPSSYLRYWTSSLDRIHDDLITALLDIVKPGQCVWDIGANMGVATFTSAYKAGSKGFVLSIDGDTCLIERLRQTAARMPASFATAEVFPVAVCDKIGVAKFNVSSYSSATNSLSGFGRFPGVVRTDSVPTVTLDWLLSQFRQPHVVKVDVEGAEALVLQGAAELLERIRPVIIIEVGSEAAAEVTQTFKKCRYNLYRMNGYSPTAFAEGDIVAIPDGMPIEQVLC